VQGGKTMKRAFGKTPAVAAALILTMIPVLAGCRDDGEPAPGAAAPTETALTEAADRAETEMETEAYDAPPDAVAEPDAAARTPPAIGWAVVSAGERHTAAIAADGSLWAWGGNSFGQLGNGSSGWDADSHTPMRIGTGYDWVYVSSGWGNSMAIKTDGSLWGWGSNTHGQLGDGTRTHRNAPVRIGIDYDWAHVSASFNHGVGIRTDGTLWAWGRLRATFTWDDTIEITIYGNTPVRIGDDYDWVSVSADEHAVAIRRDGSMWTWGRNVEGQLGDGTEENSSEPVRIDAEIAGADGGGGPLAAGTEAFGFGRRRAQCGHL